jgi:hypothetical protein
LVYKDSHQLHLSLAKALKQLKTMGILEDSTITFSQMLEWAQPLDGIKDHRNTPAEMTNAYDADYKKRCFIQGANFHRSKRLKWLHNRLINLIVDLELARNEASHERVTALEIEIDVMKADKNVLESQTEEQRPTAGESPNQWLLSRALPRDLVDEAYTLVPRHGDFKRRQFRTSPCGSATANPSPSKPHPARAAHAALTAHSASAPTDRFYIQGLDRDYREIGPSAAPSTRSTLGRGTSTPIPRSLTISMTLGCAAGLVALIIVMATHQPPLHRASTARARADGHDSL